MHPLFEKLRRRFKRHFVYALVLSIVILLGGGLGFWLIDPAIKTLGDGVWLAFTTATTVGYGDLVPSTLASRLFSVPVFLLGLAVLSLATSSLSAALSFQNHATDDETTLAQLMLEIRALRQQVTHLQKSLPPANASHDVERQERT